MLDEVESSFMGTGSQGTWLPVPVSWRRASLVVGTEEVIAERVSEFTVFIMRFQPFSGLAFIQNDPLALP